MATRGRNATESLLAMIPVTSVPEIQELREKMKTQPSNQVLAFYSSGLSTCRSNIAKKLSYEYAQLFNKGCDNGYVAEHNPFENFTLGIIRNQDRIINGWKAVEQQKDRLVKGLETMKKFLLPIAESKTVAETEKAVEKISYDAGGFVRPRIGCKREFEIGMVAMLNEMRIYEEKDMLMELVPIIRKAYKVIMSARKEVRSLWEEKHPWKTILAKYPIHKHREIYGDWYAARNVATAHLTAGFGFETEEAMKNIKVKYPDI